MLKNKNNSISKTLIGKLFLVFSVKLNIYIFYKFCKLPFESSRHTFYFHFLFLINFPYEYQEYPGEIFSVLTCTIWDINNILWGVMEINVQNITFSAHTIPPTQQSVVHCLQWWRPRNNSSYFYEFLLLNIYFICCLQTSVIILWTHLRPTVLVSMLLGHSECGLDYEISLCYYYCNFNTSIISKLPRVSIFVGFK